TVHGVDHRLRARGRRVHDDGARARPAAHGRRGPARRRGGDRRGVRLGAHTRTCDTRCGMKRLLFVVVAATLCAAPALAAGPYNVDLLKVFGPKLAKTRAKTTV